MRKYTLGISICVHLFGVTGFVLSPIFATTELPEPRRAIEFIEVMTSLPPVPPPLRRAEPGPRANDSPGAAPIEAPDRIAPETGIETSDPIGEQKGVADGVLGGLNTDMPLPDVAPPPPPPPPKEPIRVGGSIREPQKIRHVAPVYPTIAQRAGVHGTVILEAVIGEDGRVRNLRPLRSVSLLDEAAMEAVRQWQFTPTLLNGQPVPVVMTVTVTFTLQR